MRDKFPNTPKPKEEIEGEEDDRDPDQEETEKPPSAWSKWPVTKGPYQPAIDESIGKKPKDKKNEPEIKAYNTAYGLVWAGSPGALRKRG
jgi:hypothetical protein